MHAVPHSSNTPCTALAWLILTGLDIKRQGMFRISDLFRSKKPEDQKLLGWIAVAHRQCQQGVPGNQPAPPPTILRTVMLSELLGASPAGWWFRGTSSVFSLAAMTRCAASRRTFSKSRASGEWLVMFETSCVMRSAACEMDAVAPRALNSCQSCGGAPGYNRMPSSQIFVRGVILKRLTSIPSAMLERRIEPSGLPPSPGYVKDPSPLSDPAFGFG